MHILIRPGKDRYARRENRPALYRIARQRLDLRAPHCRTQRLQEHAIAWSRKYQFQIQNLKAIELEVLGEKWLASVTDRVNAFGARLLAVETELAKRDLSTLSTPQLLSTARQLRRQIEQAAGPVQFTVPVAEIPLDEYHEQVQDWQA
jgi:hypothetical protein